ncbi:hypothetical protein MLD38_012752 [Melastoma candidum]|uniref:Uncharacterized protein n=1 Tax=Melastoma candidum TaxID=119954 RepID=A0ACB9R7C7_9MYRT|nr:hypothetical protein MLD38_012752 [Melastoma candidum]
MDSSDEETETPPQHVSNYHFLDQDDSPVPFSVLPLSWSEGEDCGTPAGGAGASVFLHGVADNGLQKVYKEVRAWRFDLTCANPEISVLAKDGKWLKLHKPRKWFEDSVRSVLITLRGLHYLRRNHNASEDAFWDFLARVFGSYDVRPSAKDLGNHLQLITEARARDGLLGSSQLLSTFLKEEPWKKRATGGHLQSVTKPNFIVTDQEDGAMDGMDAESDDVEDDCFDSVCAFCDNGGNILCCDGKCMRSFHATIGDGEDSLCTSLGLTQEQVDATDTFYCKNCEYNQHQCFACGKLGSSDKSKGAEVFQCVSATCGYFYHPLCVAKLLHCQDGDAAADLHKRILSGEPFTCPLHKCLKCSQLENKEDHALQFAVCRRCPRAYHRKCLPREIVFENSDNDMEARAWENLLPKRILIYCLKHEIIEDLGTPVRDHIKFPGVEAKRTVIGDKRKDLPSKPYLTRGKEITKQSYSPYAPFKASEKEVTRKDKFSLATERSEKRKKVIASSGSDALKKVKVTDPSKASQNSRGLLPEVQASATNAGPSLGEQLYSYMKQSEEVNMDKRVASEGDLKRARPVKPVLKKFDQVEFSLDPDSERRITDLIKDATSSVSMKDVLQTSKIMSTHKHSQKSVMEKTITVGKLDAAVEAVRAALERIEAGGSIEDAQAVCGRDVLGQIFKWKDKLRVYLAPFLHGNHYTSYGRHFTKVEKLQEIVDKLHWYVQDGDTVVDFCCGANDFSFLMAKRLEENGKKCSYKNYDILPPKNDFHFERRDWMTVPPRDMPLGSKLIIGLNPPFGVRAALANKFIDKALEFRPKLIILIVPPETERLDLKKNPYDLIWEDDHFLSGKSFYLPGSIDENDKQMEQWNCSAPLLYLWSRRDWSTKHKTIAKSMGHLDSPDDRYKGNSVYVMERSLGEVDERLPLEGPSKETFPIHNTPIERTNRLPFEGPSRSHSMSIDTEPGNEVNGRHFEPASMPLSPPELGSIHDDVEANIAEGMSKGYMFNSEESFLVSRMPSVTNPRTDYGFRNLEGHYGDVYRPYAAEGEGRHLRDEDLRSRIRLYGQQDRVFPEMTYPGHKMGYGHGPPGYHHLGSSSEPLHLRNMSTMQRYAPQLDELNQARVGMSHLHEPPPLPGSILDDPRGGHYGYQSDSLGFASGAPYAHGSSGIWRNH